jgi:peroxiredoxin
MKAVRALGVLAAVGVATACAMPEGAGPSIGATAPEYGGTSLQGDSLELASLRGKVTLLNLWATWCAPCRHEMPFLQSVYEEKRDLGLEIVGVSVDTEGAQDLVASFIEEVGITYPILLDPQMRGLDIYRVLGLPASFLVDRSGTLVWMRYGPVSETDRDFLNALETTLQ